MLDPIAQGGAGSTGLLCPRVVDAFGVLDERKDGTIEVSCLRDVLCRLSAMSLEQAQAMIDASGALRNLDRDVDYKALLEWMDVSVQQKPSTWPAGLWGLLPPGPSEKRTYFELHVAPVLMELSRFLLDKQPANVLESVERFCQSSRGVLPELPEDALMPDPLRRDLSCVSAPGDLVSFSQPAIRRYESQPSLILRQSTDVHKRSLARSQASFCSRVEVDYENDDPPVEWVVRCAERDLTTARLLSESLQQHGLPVSAAADVEITEEEYTIWFVTPEWSDAWLRAAEKKFNEKKAVVLLPSGMNLSRWLSNLTGRGKKGPTVDIGLDHSTLRITGRETFNLLNSYWMAKLWTKITKLQGLEGLQNEAQLSKAIDDYIRCDAHSVPHVINLVGSTSFFSKWSCPLLRYFAQALADLDAKDDGKELVVITGGFRNLTDREARDNQGVGHTVAEEYYSEGGRVIHVLPEVENEEKFDKVADHLPDGTFLPLDFGLTIYLGKSNDERLRVMPKACDICFLVEGGPGAAKSAKEILEDELITVVPVRATGGAACGKFNMPPVKRPLHVDPDAWALVVEDSAGIAEKEDGPSDDCLREMAQAMATIAQCSMFPLCGLRQDELRYHSHERSETPLFTRSRSEAHLQISLCGWELPLDEFVPPKNVASNSPVQPVVTMLSFYEKSVRRYGRWSSYEEPHLLHILALVKQYMEEYVERARTEDYMNLMRAAYIRSGSKFRRVFATIVQDVIKPEPGFDKFLDVVSEKESLFFENIDTEQTVAEEGLAALLPLYRVAFVAQARLRDFTAKIADATGTLNLAAPLKKMWRCLEKIVIKYSEKSHPVNQLKDIARGAIQGNMEKLLAVFKLLLAAEEEGSTNRIRIVRVKNRFSSPPETGWADCQVMFYFVDDPSHHVCELQLVHPQLMLVRSQMGAHHEYVKIRSAMELLESYGEPLPDLNDN